MRIALGVHVSTFEVTASLVDIDLPQLAPVATRVVSVEAVPDGIGQAVVRALGSTRIQASQSGLTIAGAAVVCENAMQRQIVVDAVAAAGMEPPIVVDIFDSHLVDGPPTDVAAALLVGELEPVSPARRAVASSDSRRGIWQVAAVGVFVLAALGGVSALAMTVEPAVDTRTVIPADSVDSPYATLIAPAPESAPPAGVSPAASDSVAGSAGEPESVPPIGGSQPSVAGSTEGPRGYPPATGLLPVAPAITSTTTPAPPEGGVAPTLAPTDVEQPPEETSDVPTPEPTPEPTTTTMPLPTTTEESETTPDQPVEDRNILEES